MTIHLSILLWLPAVAGVLGLFFGRRAGWFAAFGALLSLAYAVVLLVDYEVGAAGLQYVTDEIWIAELGIHYKLGVDGLNLLLIALTSILWFAAILWTLRTEIERPGLFFLHMGIGQSAVLGALMAQDLALFVVFFDLMLVPFLFLTGQWGGAERASAVVKLVIYTLVGSLLMLAAAVAVGVESTPDEGSIDFAFSTLAQADLSPDTQKWIFLFFAAAFLVKMPAFPFHGWMPDGYRAMPIGVLAVFSGVLSKVAAYGFLRVCIPLFPDAVEDLQTLMLLIALASILYGSVMAFSTTETRLILGYSSIAQLGFIMLGIFALNQQGSQGAVLQAFNHGLVVAPAFFLVALVSARSGGSEDLRDMGGVALRAPALAVAFLIVAFVTLAMPGSANFVGEFLILLGVFDAKVAIAIIAFAGVVMASVYALRLFIRAMHNRQGEKVETTEMELRDAIVLVPLILAILAIALYPQFGLARSEATVKATLTEQGVEAPAEEAQEGPGAGARPESGQGRAPLRPITVVGPDGQPQYLDPNTGQPLEIDPQTGAPIDPSTGQPVPAAPPTGGATPDPGAVPPTGGAAPPPEVTP